jgi:hypothetical protein
VGNRIGSAPARQPLTLDIPPMTDAAGLAWFATAVSHRRCANTVA